MLDLRENLEAYYTPYLHQMKNFARLLSESVNGEESRNHIRMVSAETANYLIIFQMYAQVLPPGKTGELLSEIIRPMESLWNGRENFSRDETINSIDTICNAYSTLNSHLGIQPK